MEKGNSLGFYRFEYENGMVQTKELVTKEAHEYYKSLSNLKSDLEVKIKGKKKDKIDPADAATLKEVNATIKANFPYPYFVIGSPMHDAIQTSVITIDLTAGNGGEYKCKVTKVESAERFEEIED